MTLLKQSSEWCFFSRRPCSQTSRKETGLINTACLRISATPSVCTSPVSGMHPCFIVSMVIELMTIMIIIIVFLQTTNGRCNRAREILRSCCWPRRRSFSLLQRLASSVIASTQTLTPQCESLPACLLFSLSFTSEKLRIPLSLLSVALKRNSSAERTCSQSFALRKTPWKPESRTLV